MMRPLASRPWHAQLCGDEDYMEQAPLLCVGTDFKLPNTRSSNGPPAILAG